MTSISVIIITYKRHKEVLNAISSVAKDPNCDEIVVIDNDPASDLGRKLPKDTAIRYFLQKRNLGVAGGRNVGVSESRGDLLVFLDDDAVFCSGDFFSITKEYFARDAKLACLAYRIENYFSRKIIPREFPHPNVRLADQEMLVGYYVGAGHAFRKSVLDELGPFLDMEYGAEELEYSYRLVMNHYTIKYTPKVVVLHKASPKGRHSSGKNIYFSLRNRFWVLSRHLPWRYMVVNVSLWSLVWLYRAAQSNNLSYYFRGLKDGLRKLRESILKNERHVLTSEALNYLKRHGGRLWF